MGGKNNKFFIFGLVVIVLVVLGLLLAVFKTRVSFLGRAVETSTPSLQDSYLFASPLLASSTSEKIRLSAFLLNKQKQGVEGQQIQISSDPSLTIKPIQAKTDKYGGAIFEASSDQAGQFIVTASYNGQPFPQTVTLTFK